MIKGLSFNDKALSLNITRSRSYFNPEPTEYHLKSISASKLQTYIDCPRKFYYQNVERVFPKLIFEQKLTPIDLGRIEHEVIEKYFEQKLKDKKVFQPTKGCPLKSIEVSENIQLIILDSQWYLEDWDKHPTINDNCDEIKTREALFLEIEGEIKKNQNIKISQQSPSSSSCVLLVGRI